MFRDNDQFMPAGSLFSLGGSVGWNGGNAREDVAKVETLLGRSGYLDVGKTDGPTGYFGRRVEQAVKKYQKDYGLKKDGHINPHGETLRNMYSRLAEINLSDNKASGHSKTPDGKSESPNGTPSNEGPPWWLDGFEKSPKPNEHPPSNTPRKPVGAWPGGIRG